MILWLVNRATAPRNAMPSAIIHVNREEKEDCGLKKGLER